MHSSFALTRPPAGRLPGRVSCRLPGRLSCRLALRLAPPTAVLLAAAPMLASPASTTGASPASSAPVDFEGAHYKPGTGLVIDSRDGRFGVAVRLRGQYRYSMYGDEGAPLTHTLQLRRARLQFKGHSFGADKKFKIELAFSAHDLGYQPGAGVHHIPVLTWYLDLGRDRDAKLKIGQYKVPFNRQRVISSGNLELVDRSIGNGEFNLDRDTGLEVYSKDLLGLGRLRYHAGVFMNRGRDLSDKSARVRPHLMYLARLDFLPLGLFDDFSEGDLARLPGPRLALGAAFGYLDDAVKDRGIGGHAPADGGTTDFTTATADLLFKMSGAALLAEAYWRKGRRMAGGALDGGGVAIPEAAPRDGTGWFAQASYVFAGAPLQMAGRYGEVLAADKSALTDLHEAGAGLSWYLGGHAWKVQADWFNRWGGVDFRHGDKRLRVQVQAAY